MTSSDVLVLIRQLCPDLVNLDASLLNFIDRANKRLVKRVLFPDCWMTTKTIAQQQEYQSLPIFKVNAVYVAGQLATETSVATLEGRQIELYSQVPTPQAAFVSPVAATGAFLISGPITTGDVLTSFVNGIPVAYIVQVTDTTLAILAASIAAAITADLNAGALVKAVADATTAGKIDVTAVAAGSAGDNITLAATISGGATETFVVSESMAGGTDGSGGAPGTLGPYAPAWSVQEPATYPVQNTWFGAMRPDAQPYNFTQPPRYYWRGGYIAVVPNILNAGATIAIDCVRQPDTINAVGQVMTSPDIFMDAIAWDAISMAHFSAADSKSIALAEGASNMYKEHLHEILLWKGDFKGDAFNGPKLLTQRNRMGRARSRFNKR